MTFLKRLFGAAALAGAMAVMQTPAEAAQRATAIHLAAGTGMKAETVAQQTAARQTKSVVPRKRSRCNG